MKKLLIIFILFTGFANAQIVNIPDTNFKAKLIAANPSNSIAYSGGSLVKIDINDDNEIQFSEATIIDSLDVSYSNIIDITGIESFTNLKNLNCMMNSISSLDISALPELLRLDCFGNQLTSLDVSNNIQIKFLFCQANLLTTIDVSSLINLENFHCNENQLTSLNVSGLVYLQTLVCDNNQLNSVDVSDTTSLKFLLCSNNQLTSLNLSSNAQLQELLCSENQITSLQISGLTNLEWLNCSNNQLANIDLAGLNSLLWFWCSSNLLTSIDVSDSINLVTLDCNLNSLIYLFLKNNNPLWSVLSFSNNPNIQYICADEEDITLIQNNLNTYGYTNCIVNTYCTFTPGGNYNSITGSMLFDANNNGCDLNDPQQPNIKININDGTNQGVTFTNNSGNYSFYTQTGSFDVTPNVENPTFFNFSPTSATIPFANNNNNTVTQNFCISANGVHSDVEIVIAPITPARPGFDAKYQIVYKNKGNQLLSGNITFTYDDAILDFVSATQLPDTQSIGLLNWNYTNLLPFENRSFYVTLNVNSPQEIPPVNIGNILNFVATITPVVGDENAEDNLFSYKQTVVGSFDPNDIECLEGNVVSPSEIGNYLHYIINFENTGTFEAENIVVKTIIDETKFDVNSLQMLNTSHNAFIKQTGNVVEFIFENIALDSGGHGNVLLKIKSKNDLVTGDAVSKRADIFFDYNAPIDTGLVNTIFQSLSTPDFQDNSIAVYPNPTSSIINIKSDFNIQSVQLYDVQGRILLTQLINEFQSSINISEKSNGIYFLKINSDKGTKVERVVKQ